MKLIKPFLLLAALMTLPLAFAQTITGPNVVISWTSPSANTDGSTPASFEGFNLYRTTTLPIVTGKTPGPIAGSSVNPLSVSTLNYTDRNVPPGTYYYGITAWHCDSASSCTESAAATSGAVVVKAVPKTPGVPGSLTVTVNSVQAPQ